MHPTQRLVLAIFILFPSLTGGGCQAEKHLESEPDVTIPEVQQQPETAQVVVQEVQNQSSETDKVSPTEEPPAESVTELFDGKTLDGWEVTNFGGEGECRVKGGLLVIETGDPMSGINSTREDLPTTNYEIRLEAKQTSGIDFFCGLTFPVADSHCTLIVGGWAGAVVGLSSIDGDDASHNESRILMTFEDDRWYKIKVRVERNRIQAWIDDERVIDQNIEGREVSLRNETLACRPLGICNFESTSEFRNVQLVKLRAP